MRGGKVDAVGAEFFLHLRHQRPTLRAREIHFVDKQENGDLIRLQKAPERARVALYAVRSADDEDRVVQYRERALHLRGKVRMTRGVKKRQNRIADGEDRLLGKNRDAALALQRFGVQKGVAVIDATELSQRAACI